MLGTTKPLAATGCESLARIFSICCSALLAAGFTAPAAAPSVASAALPPVDVPVGRLPPSNTQEIAEFGDHLAWVDALTDTAGRRVSVVLDRSRDRTVRLPIAPVDDLDLGPGPDGKATAVYVRCTPSCDVWRYDFARRSEQRIRQVSAAGISERLPTVWGSRVAFERRRSVVLGDLGGRASQTIARRIYPDDIELGAKHLAYVGLFEGDVGNGTVQLRLRGLASTRERVLAEGSIGEGTSTGFGALTFTGPMLHGVPPLLFWQKRRSRGCSIFAPSFSLYYPSYEDEPGFGLERISRTRAPMAVRRAVVVPPATPAGEGCK